MKNLQLKASLSLLIILFFSSCTKDHNETFYSTTKEYISQGKWSVDYYYSGSDKTALYSGIHFNFLGNGTVTGTDGGQDFSGSWSVVRDVNYQDVLKICIHTQDPHLIELNDQWKVTDKNISVISMKDRSGELRFKKL